MKFSHLLVMLTLLFLASCKDDDTPNPTGATVLKYDKDNVSGPLLDAGAHELAVRFPASTMSEYVGKKLTEIQVFVGNLPQTCILKLYKQGNSSTPGQLFYQSNVLSAITPGQWNKFPIPESTPDITVNGEDIWVSVYIEHAVKQQSIGCDAGPRKTNADWLYSASDQAWKTYQERTSESVNWNIRALIQ